MQVIIYTNSNGNVSVCIPTGELPINQVLAKDCPAGAGYQSSLPQGDDAQILMLRKLGSTVTVNLVKPTLS
jgi:hypothetical protein